MSVISLTTDFGQKDGYIGVMKGVIWKIAPQVQIADITHLIAPQNISAAALVLVQAVPYFPPWTIHVAVVDPGVGTQRRPMLAQIGEQYFVGPDNGIITPWLEKAEREGAPTLLIHLNRPEYWLDQVSSSFHGRDIFAPVAAHLANGAAPEALGEPFSDPVRIPLSRPQPTAAGWQGEIIHIDHFGNLASNIRREHLAGRPVAAVLLTGAKIHGLANTFGERLPGELAAMINSSGSLEVAEVNGSAARRLNAHPGDPIEVIFSE